MNFNTALFLFLFLPAFLIIYFTAQPKWRAWVGLAGSLVFYAWGQMFYIPLIAGLIALNYWIGLRLKPGNNGGRGDKRLLYLGILINIGLLGIYKLLITYGIRIFGDLINFMPESVQLWLAGLVFPLGLSYISFQVVSYLVDVANGSVEPEKDPLNFALYIFLFPKLLVGPITRYKSLADQLSGPSPSREMVADGIRRFIQGFAKKVLIADGLAKLVDSVFGMAAPNVPPEIAWLALAAYALQIYFDFSGYTDMAIGLGSMMGFTFIENFNYPYIAQSISDFWRRWHISLSSWFRDYVFYPLERRRIKLIGQPLNLILVFLLTGLWHGVTATYILWGLLHGVLMALESLILAKLLRQVYRPIRHLYALSAILLTWLFFRSPTPDFALGYLARLFGKVDGLVPLPFTQTAPLPFIEPSFWLAFGFAILFSFPILPFIEERAGRLTKGQPALNLSLIVVRDIVLLLLLVLSVGAMASNKFLPGIYGNF
jgi:alginate O-acetyltransferase complex protein AlgI